MRTAAREHRDRFEERADKVRRARGRWLVVSVLIIAAASGMNIALLTVSAMREGDAGALFEEGEAGTFASAALLACCALVCLAVAARRGDLILPRWLFLLGAAGFMWLAADDLFMLHERIDFLIHDAMGWDRHNRYTDKIDDAIVAGYGGVAFLVALRYRERVVRLRWMCVAGALGGALFAGMVFVDVFGISQPVEESLKLLSATFLLCALLGARLDPRLRVKPEVASASG